MARAQLTTRAEAGNWRFPVAGSLAGSTAPPKSRTTGALLDEMALRHGKREAVVSRRSRHSYRDLSDWSIEIARSLLSLGLGKGDRVGIFMSNRPEFIAIWMGVNRIGAVAVGVSTWSSDRELEYIVRHSDMRALLMQDELRERSAQDRIAMLGARSDCRPVIQDVVTPRAPCLRTIGIVGQNFRDDLAPWAHQVTPDLLQEVEAEILPLDDALMTYTSGSTGHPKGVRLTHQTMIENAYNIGEAVRLTPESRYWLSLPLFWSAGNANVTMSVLTHGSTVVLQEFFEPIEAAHLLREERCTHYFAFSNVTHSIVEALDGRKLPHLQIAISSGEPENLRLLRGMGATSVLHPYGTTEDYGFATITAPEDDDTIVSTTQGNLLPGFDLRIVDPNSGDVVACGELGEICLRGHVTPGYHKDRDLNARTFDEEGFFHTGDLGVLTPEGRLRFSGRIKEMVKPSGFNVAPVEVETVLQSHPDVAEAYVVGVRDPKTDAEIVAAAVRARPGTTPSLDELYEYCRRELSSYKVPRLVVVCDELPLTATGKVSKQEIQVTLQEKINAN